MKSVFACSLGPLCCSHFSLNHLPSTLLQPLEPVNPGALITSPILYPRRVEFPAQWKEPCESEQPGLCPSKESSALSDYSSVGEALCLPQELQGQITKVLWGLRILPFNISLTCTRFVHFLFICYLFLSWVFLWVNMSSMVSCLLLPSPLFFLPFFFLRHHLIYFKAFQIPKMWTVEWSAICPYNDSGLSWPVFIYTIWFYFIRTLCIWTVINNTESGKKKKKRIASAGPLGPAQPVLRPKATFPAASDLKGSCPHCAHRLEQLVLTGLLHICFKLLLWLCCPCSSGLNIIPSISAGKAGFWPMLWWTLGVPLPCKCKWDFY